MKPIIYFFSGTGNSLDVARKISAALETPAELISIANHFNDAEIQVAAEVVGFVFPVYMGDAPWVVKEFVKKMRFTASSYIFAVATCNNNPRKCLPIFRELLKTRSQTLALGEIVAMPGNAKMSSLQVNEERLGMSGERCIAFAKKVDSRTVEDSSLAVNLPANAVLSSPRKKLDMAFTHFKVSRACNGCGTCKRVCPMANIELPKQKTTWGKNCVACLACFHWCPQKAITFRLPLLGNRPRYHHPDVSIKDIFVQQPL